MINLQPETMRTLRIVPGAHWRNLPTSYWYGPKQQKHRRCHYCHPSPVPPFPDCPHGHFMTPRRIEEQIRYEWRSDFIWYTGFGLLSCIFLAGGLVIFLFGFAMWLFFFTAFLINHYCLRRWAKNLYRAGVRYDDYESFSWEPATKRNEPWNRRYYP